MNEREFIRTLSSKASNSHPLLHKGIGDDCAIFSSSPKNDWLVSTDMLVEGVHFNTTWHDPYLLGRKSLAVNISDVAAMGGSPQFVLLSLAVPSKTDDTWTNDYMDGLFSMAEEHQCNLIGGDTVSTNNLTISVTVIGTVQAGCAITRDNANAGDPIYVSGNLGSAAAGLHLCQQGKFTVKDCAGAKWQALINHHLDPTPRTKLAELLQASSVVSSMQDISDGIATDLSHICSASSVGAHVEESLLPAHPELIEMCSHFNLDPVDFQIRGGEDYELLFTVEKGAEKKLEEIVYKETGKRIYRIGTIVKGEGVTMLTKASASVSIDYQGYEHTS